MKHNSNKGFSLVELLVSIAILSIIMVMVVQFMGTASVTLRKTRKKMDLQSDAMEFREQFSDLMMQATYIRVQSVSGNVLYEKKSTLEAVTNGKNDKVEFDSKGSSVSIPDGASSITVNFSGTLVCDTYPNYLKEEPRGLDIYLNKNTYSLYGKDSGGNTVSDASNAQSFRLLSDAVASGQPYYVKPEYIYIRYQPTYDYSTGYLTSENYAIFRMTVDGIYVYKGSITGASTTTDDGFLHAKGEVILYQIRLIPVIRLMKKG